MNIHAIIDTSSIQATDAPADLHIGMNFDAGFYLPAGVLLESVFANNADIVTEIHIFTDRTSAEDMQRLRKLSQKYQRNIRLYYLNMPAFQGFHIHHHHYSRVAYARLYMAEVLAPLTERFFYLDADTLVIGSFKPLITLDMQGKTIAACPIVDNEGGQRHFINLWKLQAPTPINAGIMLISAHQWTAKGYTEKCFAYQGRPAKEFFGHDQDIINRVFDGDILYIDEKYNDQLGARYLAGRESVILHFTGRIKPWSIALEVSPLVREWRSYGKQSPWPISEKPLPAKIPKNYYYFKFASEYYRSKGQYLRALNAYLTYAVLKGLQVLRSK